MKIDCVKFVGYNPRSWCSPVGIATGYGLDDLGVWSLSPNKVKNFHCSIPSRWILGPTQPPIQWVPEALSPRGKVAGA
jgi:hypothetical protein